MRRGGTRAGIALVAALTGLALASCASTGPGAAGTAGAAADTPEGAIQRLLDRVDPFRVGGGVRTDEGLLLPELITIEVKSEICVESRRPGTRFWSLEYDTCFVFTSVDTLDRNGQYAVAVPSLDADLEYESRHSFGDLRLVQRGPVSFLARSDAGWKHQETFTSSRNQRRDLVLTLETDRFWVVAGDAPLRERPDEGAAVLRNSSVGTGLDVIRFHQGWAECVLEGKIGWMEMRFLGTQREVDVKRPARATSGNPPENAPD
jgi:hypothetical protein